MSVYSNPMAHVRQVGITKNEVFAVARVISLRFPQNAIGNRVICLGMHPLDHDSFLASGSSNQVERLAADTRAFISPLARLFTLRLEISKLDVHV